MNAKKLLVLFSMVLLVVVACSKRELKYNSGEYYDARNDQIANFERDLKTARDNKISELAPKEYDKAVKAFTEAKEIARESEDEEDLEDFRVKMHAARMELDRAKEIAQNAK